MKRELSPLTRSEDDRRELIVWAVSCAQRVLPLFEETSSGDHRPREALVGAMAFARGELRVGPVRRLAVACHAAAREAGHARSHCSGPGVWPGGCGRPHGAHARAVPTYVFKALTIARSDDPTVLDSEKAWQRAHLPEGFAKFVYPAG